jgi:metal-responsive CopG/Arc/MetJ family transcriptional regulator
MKIKTSITLTDTLVKKMDTICGGAGHRSAFVEQAIHAKLAEIAHQQREAKDLIILNHLADELNEESKEVLGGLTE